MSVRSQAAVKLVATACGHHTQVYGSLVLIDPQQKDDGRMSTVRRLTPEQWFPESEYRLLRAWRRDVFDRLAAKRGLLPLRLLRRGPRRACASGNHAQYNYGVYLIDSLGNRELLYRDPEFLLPQADPHAAADPAAGDSARHAGRATGGATAARSIVAEEPTCREQPPSAVMNVYHGTLPFPEGTQIDRSCGSSNSCPRPRQVANDPRIGYGDQKGARRVLGSVPVEADGSAHFELPTGVPVYFQAIDRHGVGGAVDAIGHLGRPGREDSSARAATNGARRPARSPRSYPSALQPGPVEDHARGPRLRPAELPDPRAAGARCESASSCHAEGIAEGHRRTAPISPAAAPASTPRDRDGKAWYTSYHNSAPATPSSGTTPPSTLQPATTPGRFGARASRLYRLLQNKATTTSELTADRVAPHRRCGSTATATSTVPTTTPASKSKGRLSNHRYNEEVCPKAACGPVVPHAQDLDSLTLA